MALKAASDVVAASVADRVNRTLRKLLEARALCGVTRLFTDDGEMLTQPHLSRGSGQPRGRSARAHARKSREERGEGHVGLSDAQLHHSRQLPQTQRRIPATANPSL